MYQGIAQFTYETPNVVSSGIAQFTYETPNVVAASLVREYRNYELRIKFRKYDNLRVS